MCVICSLSLSRIPCISWTASKGFSLFFITQHLLRCSDLKEWIAKAQIHGVVTVNSLQVHNILKIPTYQHIHAADGCQGDVLRIHSLGCNNHPCRNVPLGQRAASSVSSMSSR